ncbi:MAG: M15 family metallopeptidase [Treponema sp.]|jgi:D-alanyl-D-alanine carboxypeptidase|nr:M15 family metallopeptidase [Treponema sp.]
MGNFTKGAFFLLAAVLVSCGAESQRGVSPRDSAVQDAGEETGVSEDAASESPEGDLEDAIARLSRAADGTQPAGDFWNRLRLILEKAEIPEDISRNILSTVMESPSFILDLLFCLEGDPFLYALVDKQHALPDRYEPSDLVPLGGGSYRVSRDDLRLREAAALSLEEMAAAAKKEGVIITVSSAYRSFDYQVEVYERNVREMGKAAADRESARPGFSQHQTGLTADFGSITDAFAETEAGRWMAANAGRFGWSLSFPQGYEDVTGYRWESWHFRYTGKELNAFIDAYFGGIQQYALRFIHEWKTAEQTASSVQE